MTSESGAELSCCVGNRGGAEISNIVILWLVIMQVADQNITLYCKTLTLGGYFNWAILA